MFLCRSGQDYYHGRFSGYRTHPERLSCKGKKGCKRRDHGLQRAEEHILGQAAREECKNCANNDAPSPSSDDASDAQDGADDFAIPGNDWLASAISSAMDSNDTMAVAKEQVQDIYAARKLRKKARNTQKHR